MIRMLAPSPKLLIADEPTTALSHSLPVVAQLASGSR
jgi:ABC-type dipeptide/oligopeptide/nickel transport system ATPase component